MLVTLTNTSGASINDVDTLTGGTGTASLTATGGNRTNPVPYPFSHIGSLADGATKILAMHPRDWRYRSVVNGSPHDASEEWQALVQAGTVTMSHGAQTGRRDEEELQVNAI